MGGHFVSQTEQKIAEFTVALGKLLLKEKDTPELGGS